MLLGLGSDVKLEAWRTRTIHGSGASSSIMCPIAGQVVSEGFLHCRTSPTMRRTVTRLIAVISSMTVIAVGCP
ncbi:hypothetical protein E4T56_gene15266 [Termitomyces sp. T112]|nr:hypothetical protein E4T56_gene15266 [Termitomyces sp. T112]